MNQSTRECSRSPKSQLNRSILVTCVAANLGALFGEMLIRFGQISPVIDDILIPFYALTSPVALTLALFVGGEDPMLKRLGCILFYAAVFATLGGVLLAQNKKRYLKRWAYGMVIYLGVGFYLAMLLARYVSAPSRVR
jgi:hypothetical protein